MDQSCCITGFIPWTNRARFVQGDLYLYGKPSH